jgi:hypothetical protein
MQYPPPQFTPSMMLDDMEDIVADMINGGHGVEQDGVSIGDEPLFTDELTQYANA